MDKPIGVGDLIYGHKGCCAAMTERITGKVRRVVRLKRNDTRCPYCDHISDGPHAYAKGNREGAPAWWLRRIPTLEELESERTEETLKEQRDRLQFLRYGEF